MAKLLGGRRNPLSGGSNITDQGHKRVGDVVGVEKWLVEVKDTSSKDAMYTFYKSIKRTNWHGIPLIHCLMDTVSTIPDDNSGPERMVVLELNDLRLHVLQQDPRNPYTWLRFKHAYYTKRFPFGEWWEKLESDHADGLKTGAIKEGQKPLLVVHTKGKRETLAILRLNDLISKMEQRK